MCGPLSRNQSNSVACKEAAAIRGCANAATAMAHRRGTFCAERCGESATDHVRINGLPGSGMIDVTECRELATECRQMADRAQTFRVRSILIDIARTWDRLALELEHSTARTPLSRCCDLPMRISSHANKSQTLSNNRERSTEPVP